MKNNSVKWTFSLCVDPAAGISIDWYATQGGRYAYTPELREGPVSVFVLPEEEIIPSGEEVWAAWESMLDNLLAEAGVPVNKK